MRERKRATERLLESPTHVSCFLSLFHYLYLHLMICCISLSLSLFISSSLSLVFLFGPSCFLCLSLSLSLFLSLSVSLFSLSIFLSLSFYEEREREIESERGGLEPPTSLFLARDRKRQRGRERRTYAENISHFVLSPHLPKSHHPHIYIYM